MREQLKFGERWQAGSREGRGRGLPASRNPKKEIMDFDDVAKKAAAAIREAEKAAPIGMFSQFLHELNAALTQPEEWPLVAREAAYTATEIGTLNFVNWLHGIRRCKEPIHKAFRLSSEFVATHHIVVEDHRFLVYKLLYELQGISTHSSAFIALTGLERIAQLSVRISFDQARAGSQTRKTQPSENTFK